MFREHKACVKAISWCPNEPGMIATGGGTSDRTIKIWDSSSGTVYRSINTRSQVGGLHYTKYGCLVSVHGFSDNEAVVWNTKTFERRATLSGHESRITFSALNASHTKLVTGSGDETLRIWDIGFQSKSEKKEKETSTIFSTHNLR